MRPYWSVLGNPRLRKVILKSMVLPEQGPAIEHSENASFYAEEMPPAPEPVPPEEQDPDTPRLSRERPRFAKWLDETAAAAEERGSRYAHRSRVIEERIEEAENKADELSVERPLLAAHRSDLFRWSLALLLVLLLDWGSLWPLGERFASLDPAVPLLANPRMAFVAASYSAAALVVLLVVGHGALAGPTLAHRLLGGAGLVGTSCALAWQRARPVEVVSLLDLPDGPVSVPEPDWSEFAIVTLFGICLPLAAAICLRRAGAARELWRSVWARVAGQEILVERLRTRLEAARAAQQEAQAERRQAADEFDLADQRAAERQRQAQQHFREATDAASRFQARAAAHAADVHSWVAFGRAARQAIAGRGRAALTTVLGGTGLLLVALVLVMFGLSGCSTRSSPSTAVVAVVDVSKSTWHCADGPCNVQALPGAFQAVAEAGRFAGPTSFQVIVAGNNIGVDVVYETHTPARWSGRDVQGAKAAFVQQVTRELRAKEWPQVPDGSDLVHAMGAAARALQESGADTRILLVLSDLRDERRGTKGSPGWNFAARQVPGAEAFVERLRAQRELPTLAGISPIVICGIHSKPTGTSAWTSAQQAELQETWDAVLRAGGAETTHFFERCDARAIARVLPRL